MNRVILVSALLFMLTGTPGLYAQEQSSSDAPSSKFYMKIAGGYFFSVTQGEYPNVGPYPPHDAQMVFDPANQQTSKVSEKVLTGSYGEGVRGGLTFGWNINKYIALEGTFNYYQSKKNLMTRERTTVKGSEQEVGRVESKGYANAIDFAPSVVISPGYEKINPYVRFGVIVPLWGRLHIETGASRRGPVPGQPAAIIAQTSIHREEEVKPNVTFGFQGAVGMIIPVGRKLDIFVEAEYRNVPSRGKEKEITAYDETTTVVNSTNGAVISTQQRGLNDLSVAEKNTEYVTTLDQSSNTPVGQEGTKVIYKDNNRPSNDLKSYINIGGLGANAGLRLRF